VFESGLYGTVLEFVDKDSQSGSRSRKAKMAHKKKREKSEIYVLKSWAFSLEG
jgi:hypothetical protein